VWSPIPIPITVVPPASTDWTDAARASTDPRVIPSASTIRSRTSARVRPIRSAAWMRLNSSTLDAFSNSETGGADCWAPPGEGRRPVRFGGGEEEPARCRLRVPPAPIERLDEVVVDGADEPVGRGSLGLAEPGGGRVPGGGTSPRCRSSGRRNPVEQRHLEVDLELVAQTVPWSRRPSIAADMAQEVPAPGLRPRG
jgi:hypothetical protein